MATKPVQLVDRQIAHLRARLKRLRIERRLALAVERERQASGAGSVRRG